MLVRYISIWHKKSKHTKTQPICVFPELAGTIQRTEIAGTNSTLNLEIEVGSDKYIVVFRGFLQK